MDPVDETLRVTVGQDPDGTPVVVLDGELDVATAATAHQAFATLPETSDGPVDIVVDMTDLTFMDSTGLTVLLLVAKHGYAVRLRNPSGIVRRLVTATGLAETLVVEP